MDEEKERLYTRAEWFEAYKKACDVEGISAPPFSRILRELPRPKDKSVLKP